VPTIQYKCGIIQNLSNIFGKGIKQNREQSTVGYTGQVATRKDFENAMTQAKKEADKIHFIEVVMPTLDAPMELIQTIEGGRKNNKQ